MSCWQKRNRSQSSARLRRKIPYLLTNMKQMNPEYEDSTVEALIVDFLLWLAQGEKSYEAVMEAWRTSCPKLPVWEEVNDRGFVSRERINGHSVVRITESGLTYLERRKHAPEPAAPYRRLPNSS